jgi:threonine aldolase
MTVEAMAGIAAAARDAGLPLHVDGARLWNAAAALAVPVARLAAGATTVMVSFSKGLGCPIGSCLALPAGDRPRAWEIRKRLGGGMRQSGILAAAALWALDNNVTRLAEDHANARLLAERVTACRTLRAEPPQSNVVMIDLTREGDTAEAAAATLARAGVLMVPFGPRRLRAVTHLDVTRPDVERASEVIGRVLA